MPPPADSVAALYRRHAPMVLRRARRMLGDEEEAREVVQDIFVRFVEKPDSFEGRSALTTWLYAVTTNACLVRLRNQKTRARLLSQHHADARSNGSMAPDAALILRDAVQRLPPRLAEVAIYHYLDELTQAETAEVMGCSRRTVVSLLAELRRSPLSQEVPSCSMP